MKRLILLLVVLAIAAAGHCAAAEPESPDAASAVPEIDAFEAHEMMMADPANTRCIDCRSMAEYELIGHPPMAYNIPSQFWTSSGYVENEGFLDDVGKRFKKSDTLLMLCRSGKRSRRAARLLINAGYEHVFNVAGGFEGPKIEDEQDPRYGLRRFTAGWLYYGLPYTYELLEPLKYELHTSCGCD